MDLHLKGRHVFVAGASQGIGLGITEGFLAEGASVTMAARTESKLQAKATDLRAQFGAEQVAAFAGDMTQSEEISAALSYAESELGPVQIAIANVGISETPLGYDITDEEWEDGISQNLHSAFGLARAVLPQFEQQGGGSLILISSVAGLTALGTQINYGTCKAAVNHMTRELARHVGKKNIRVNAVCPGNIKFPGGSWEQREKERPEAWGRWIKREVAMARFGECREIADACVWLSSDRASFVTGAVIPVDGGQATA